MKETGKRMKRQLALVVISALVLGMLPVGNQTVSRAASPDQTGNPPVSAESASVSDEGAAALAQAASAPAEKSARAGYGLNSPRTNDDGVVTWDCVWFGNYWQEDTNGDGKADKNDAKTPVKWRVLSVDGDDAFLLADQNLDCQKYNDTDTSVTWETCTMRSWLNGYGAEANKNGTDYSSNNFLNNAFTGAEQRAIRTTNVVNNDNPEYGTAGGNDTSDKVYLLSIDEVTNPAYGFLSDYSKYGGARRAKNTKYAKTQGALTSTEYAGNGPWWPRSPGRSSKNASYVDNCGSVLAFGCPVYDYSVAVRPALHLNLSSASSWSYAGTVTSEGGVNEEATPVPATGQPDPTPEVTWGEKPSADIPGGMYAGPQSVTLTAGAGADIYYTTDGTEPDASNGMRYTEPVRIRESCTLKAAAVRDGAVCSDIMAESYTIMESRDSVMIDGYTFYVTDTSGNPVYNADIVIGTRSGSTDRDGKCEFSSIKGWAGDDGAAVFNVTVQAGGYADYRAYDCAVSENHVTYITMLTVSEADEPGVSLLKNDCFESVLWKDAVFGNIDLMVNQKTISLSEPDATFDLTVNVKPGMKDEVKKYTVLSGCRRVAESTDGVFRGMKYSLFGADQKVYIQIDLDQGSGEIRRAATQRQQISLLVKDPGESAKESYGSLSLGENLSFTVSEDIPFVGGTKFNLAKLNLPIDMKFGTDGSFVLSVNSEEDELFKTKNGILFKNYDEKKLKENKEKQVVDDTFLGCLRDALAASTENLAAGKDEQAFKDFELKFSDQFKFTTKIGGYISGKLNESCKKGTGNLYIMAKAGYKGEMQAIVYAVPIVISFEVGAEGKLSATLHVDFTDPSKKISDCIDGELLFHLNPYVKVGAGPGCKELNVKLKGGFELPVDYYLLGGRKGLQSIKLKANAAVSGKVFGFEKEWEFWKDERNIYTRPERAKLQRSFFDMQKDWEETLTSGAAYALPPQTDVQTQTEEEGLKEQDVAQIAEERTWNAVPVPENGGSRTLNDRVSAYTDTKTAVVGDTVLMVYSDVDAERGPRNADVLYYSVYDKASGQWGAPVQVDENTTADYDFDLYSDGNRAYLVWQEMDRELTASDSVEDMTACTHISYAEFSPATGKFSDFAQLSDGGHYVMQPSVVANGDEITVGWIGNTAKDYYALNDTNEIVLRTCQDGVWKDAVTCLADSCKIMELQGCVLDGTTYFAYISDSDNSFRTEKDRNVCLLDASGAVTPAASDGKLNANLVYSAAGEKPSLYWYQGDTVVCLSSADGSPSELVTGLSINPSEDFQMMEDGQGGQAVLFTHDDSGDGGDVTEAYVMYRQPDRSFSHPVQVTEDGACVSGYSGVLLDGDALISYRLDEYSSGADSIAVSSSLHSTRVGDFSKVSLEEVSYEYDGMQKGNSLVLQALVTNRSNHAVTELAADVVDPSGESAGTYTVPVSLGAGESSTVSVPVSVPEQPGDGEYTLTVKEKGKQGAEGGSQPFRLLYSELKIRAEQIMLGETPYLSCTVENRGDLATKAVVGVTRSDAPGQTLANAEIEEVAAGGYEVVRIPVTAEMLSPGNIYTDFTLCVQAEWPECYQYDNSAMLQVASPVRQMALNPENLDLKVNETEQLEVQIDALGTPAFEYEWSSSDETVAGVSETGTVSANAPGEAVITVMTKQGDFAQCVVHVSASPQEGDPTASPAPDTVPTASPDAEPTMSPAPDTLPTASPDTKPTVKPTKKPDITASAKPTAKPGTSPKPSKKPDAAASAKPTVKPTKKPDTTASAKPTAKPGTSPKPTKKPDVAASAKPTVSPAPGMLPTASPDAEPTVKPTEKPDAAASAKPDVKPTGNPSGTVTAAPSAGPGASVPLPSANLPQLTAPVSQLPVSPDAADIGKVSAVKLKQKKQIVTVSWKNVPGASGYQVCYSASKKWKNKKQKLTRKTKLTVKKLKTKKTYYFRVRAYRMNGTEKVYGAWSKTRKVKIKK